MDAQKHKEKIMEDKFAPIQKVKELPLDGRCPHMSISHDVYMKGLENLRDLAKIERRILLTDDGIEDYTGEK